MFNPPSLRKSHHSHRQPNAYNTRMRGSLHCLAPLSRAASPPVCGVLITVTDDRMPTTHASVGPHPQKNLHEFSQNMNICYPLAILGLVFWRGAVQVEATSFPTSLFCVVYFCHKLWKAPKREGNSVTRERKKEIQTEENP